MMDYSLFKIFRGGWPSWPLLMRILAHGYSDVILRGNVNSVKGEFRYIEVNMKIV